MIRYRRRKYVCNQDIICSIAKTIRHLLMVNISYVVVLLAGVDLVSRGSFSKEISFGVILVVNKPQ